MIAMKNQIIIIIISLYLIPNLGLTLNWVGPFWTPFRPNLDPKIDFYFGPRYSTVFAISLYVSAAIVLVGPISVAICETSVAILVNIPKCSVPRWGFLTN